MGERQSAYDLLGPTGSVTREPAVADVYPSSLDSDHWIVWVVDSDGAMLETIFAGPSAEQRAKEYAQAKYSGLRYEAPRHPQYDRGDDHG